MNKEADRRQVEETVAVGLIHEPKRLDELSQFKLGYFLLPECRLIYWVVAEHRRQNLLQGKIRYAGKQAIGRGIDEWVSLAKDRDSRRKRTASARAAKALVEDAASIDYADDHTYRDAVDRLREMAMDDVGSKGILDLVETLRKAGPKGLASGLRDLASRVSAVGSPVTVGELSVDASGVLRDYAIAKKSPNSGYIETPFPLVNQACGGGRRGRQWTVAGYAKDGKTTLALALAYHAAVAQKLGVFIATGEQTRSDVRDAMVVRHSHSLTPGGLPFRAVTNGTLNAEQEKILAATVKDLSAGGHGSMSYFQAPGGTTMSELRAVAEAAARKRSVDVIVIDHSDLFEPSTVQRSDVSRLAAVIRESKQLSLDFFDGRGAWVILCHQIKREGYEAALKRGYYVPSDMAGSAEAERSCDVMLWVLRDDQMKEMSEARIGIGLDRRGPGIPKGFAVYERFESAALLPLEDV